ncbi:hypothetical protein Y1Q_0002973 [Alligator mississippiensis]|nr:hypothetical protein Y1Q_0002973 [Alligator mississippiensis]
MDLCFGVERVYQQHLTHSQYAQQLWDCLRRAYRLTAETGGRNQQRHKRLYDAQVHEQGLQEGDWVLLRNLGLTGRHKIADHWRAEPYTVVRQLGNLPVYKISPESGPGRSRVVHQNLLLLPIGKLVGPPPPESEPQEERPRSPRRRRPHTTQPAVVPAALPEDLDSDWWYPTDFHLSLGPATQGEGETGTAAHGALPGETKGENIPMPLPASGADSLSEREPELLGPPQSPAPDHTPRPRRELQPVRCFTYDAPGVSGEVPIAAPWVQ